MDKGPETSCQSLRQLLDRKLSHEGALTEAESQNVDLHLTACSPCRDWSRQAQAIVEVARDMPQFDVSEALTQRILTSVEAESIYGRAYVNMLAPSLVLLAVMVLFFYVESGESLEGMLSWAIGLGLMAALKLLLSGDKEVATISK